MKSAGGATVNVTVVECIIPPAVPVTVTMYCPAAIEEVVVIDRTELKLGAPDTGFNDVDIPLGVGLETVRATL